MSNKLSARDLIFNLIEAQDDVSPPSSNEVTADLIAALLGVGDLTMDEVRGALSQPSGRTRTIELDPYETSNLITLLQVAGYMTPEGLTGLNLATGDWIGTIYWKLVGLSNELWPLPKPNFSVADQLEKVRSS